MEMWNHKKGHKSGGKRDDKIGEKLIELRKLDNFVIYWSTTIRLYYFCNNNHKINL